MQSLAARLRAIHDFAIRLNRIRDLDEIASVIVEGTERLIGHDTIRVYRVDHATMMCEPIAFKGTFGGNPNPSFEELRTPIGSGLTGWAAEHNQTILTGDAGSDPRGRRVHESAAVESMLVVPMSFEDRAHGVIVVSADGRDRFGPDDEATLTIFAGYAAQAIVNFEHLDQLNRQQAELEHQLASQRRLLEVNEQLLSTLDPKGDPRADRRLAQDDRPLRRAVDLPLRPRRRASCGRSSTRDRFADVILDYAGPIDVGITGWVIEHGEAALDERRPSRSALVPDPGHAVRARVDDRRPAPRRRRGDRHAEHRRGWADRRPTSTENEFELTKLFAGQASIALENAEAHGAIKVRAEHDAFTGLRNHGQFQRELAETIAAAEGPFALLMLDLDSFKAFNDTCGHPAGDALLAGVAAALRAGIRDGDSAYRYGGDEFARDPAGREPDRGIRGRAADPAGRPGHRRPNRTAGLDLGRRRLPPGGRRDEGRAGRGRRPVAVHGEAVVPGERRRRRPPRPVSRGARPDGHRPDESARSRRSCSRRS